MRHNTRKNEMCKIIDKQQNTQQTQSARRTKWHPRPFRPFLTSFPVSNRRAKRTRIQRKYKKSWKKKRTKRKTPERARSGRMIHVWIECYMECSARGGGGGGGAVGEAVITNEQLDAGGGGNMCAVLYVWDMWVALRLRARDEFLKIDLPAPGRKKRIKR